MRRRRWLPVGALAVALLVAGSPAGASAAPGGTAPAGTAPAGTAPAGTAPAGAAPGGGGGADGRPVAGRGTPQWTVTLITGDRVTIEASPEGDRVVSVLRREGSSGVTFTSRPSRTGDLILVPGDAARLVATGELDERLFNVSRLARNGFHDKGRADLPLIVQYQPNRAKTAVVPEKRALRSINASAVQVPRAGVNAAWRALTGSATTNGKAVAVQQSLAAGVAKVWLDDIVKPSLDFSTPQIGAPQAWQAGHRGAGVTVSVIDSGVDAAHPDLAGAVVGAKDFTDSPSGVADLFGHGTHVAGIITGDGAASNGKYVGVAPDAKILNARVFGDFDGGHESWIIAAMEWSVAAGAKVVNMSLGGSVSAGDDPMSQALNRMTLESGTLFVVAAGNSGGPAIGSPGAADEALTVGAVDRENKLARFSSTGPRIDRAIKPDVTAPGVDIAAARAKGTSMDGGADLVPGNPQYLVASGTSMATPHVAGAAAIVAGQHPDWRGPDIKRVLMGSASVQSGQTIYQQGAGRVDVAAAVRQSVLATPPSLSLGEVAWPHEDDAPTVRTVSYRNTGATPVTLDVAVTGEGPRGAALPADMFTVRPAQLTIAAGGTGTATVTVDTALPGPFGYYTGAVTASGGGNRVVTPFAVYEQPRHHKLTIHAIDRDGNPAKYAHGGVGGLDLGESFALSPGPDATGTTTFSVPEDRYVISIFVDDWEDGLIFQSTAAYAEVGYPVTADTTIVLDARQAKPLRLDLDQREPKNFDAYMSQQWLRRSGSTVVVNTLMFGTAPSWVFYAFPSVTRPEPGDTLRGYLEGHWARPDGTGSFIGSPYLYRLRKVFRDRTLAGGYQETQRKRELAVVETNVGVPAGSLVGTYPCYQVSCVGFRRPTRLTQYVTAGEPWQFEVGQFNAAWEYEAYHYDAVPRAYERGRRYTESWNHGVFGPGLPPGAVLAGTAGGFLGHMITWRVDANLRHDGWPNPETSHSTLYRNGVKIGEQTGYPWATGLEVPLEVADYRLEQEWANPLYTLSNRVSAAWSFRTGSTSSFNDFKSLPFMVVRYTPALDDRDRAGRVLWLPITVQRNGEATFGNLTTVNVEVSYDDGASWQKLRVFGSGLERGAFVLHPRGAQYASLRAVVADSAGNKVEQTIIRAYAIR